MKLQRIAQILERFVLSFSLAGHVNLKALRYEPFILLPDAGAEFLFHAVNRLLHPKVEPDQRT